MYYKINIKTSSKECSKDDFRTPIPTWTALQIHCCLPEKRSLLKAGQNEELLI